MSLEKTPLLGQELSSRVSTAEKLSPEKTPLLGQESSSRVSTADKSEKTPFLGPESSSRASTVKSSPEKNPVPGPKSSSRGSTGDGGQASTLLPAVSQVYEPQQWLNNQSNLLNAIPLQVQSPPAVHLDANDQLSALDWHWLFHRPLDGVDEVADEPLNLDWLLETEVHFPLDWVKHQPDLLKNEENPMPQQLQSPAANVPDPQLENMQQAVAVVCDVDPRLNQLCQQYDEIPQFHFADDLTGFQKLLKSLLECVSTVYTRDRVYRRLVHRCQSLGLTVTRDSVVDNLTANDMQTFGARLGKGKIIIDFATMFEEAFLEMEDEQFLQNLTSIRGMGFYTAFQVNVFGRGRFDYLPARDYKFRRALSWFGVKFDNNNPTDATPTAEQARQIAQLWEPRRGIAAYLLWSASPGK